MTDLTQAGRNYERSLERMNEWIEEREEAIQARTDQIAEQMVCDRTPTVDRALRELLESPEFDDQVLDLLHAMLWHTADCYTAQHEHKLVVLKSRLLDLAAMECNVQDEARAKAEKEIDQKGDDNHD